MTTRAATYHIATAAGRVPLTSPLPPFLLPTRL